jgi:alpha-galactosidase
MTTVPFSFRYGGRDSRELLERWPSSSTTTATRHGSETTRTWLDPHSGLSVSWAHADYDGHDARTWRVVFANRGDDVLPPLVDTLAVDRLWNGAGDDWRIRTASGSTAVATDFEPQEIALADGSFRVFSPVGGRPTDGVVDPDAGTAVGGAWPYFNIDFGGSGVIVALGWPGQWGAEIARDGDALSVRGGVTTGGCGDGEHLTDSVLTTISLTAGESFETPWMAELPWAGGDWVDAQNRWRRWLIACVLPSGATGALRPIAPAQANDHFIGQIDTVDDELEWINSYGDHASTAAGGGVHDHWWIDAGWYETPEWPDPVTAWVPVGTWAPAADRFPDGLAPVTARASELGLRTIVWFEPERVMPGTWLYEERREWLLGPVADYPHFDGKAMLLDFGDDDARAWAIDHVDGLIRSQGIGVYREDFNISPLEFWNAADAEGERGHRQVRYVEGHLAFWRALLERNPGLLIDNCASGGRRMDLLSASLSVPLLRSDWVHDGIGNQAHTFGASFWAPFTGTGVHVAGPDLDYRARSGMAPSFMLSIDPRDPDAEWGGMNRLLEEWASINSAYLGDYYPLTPYSVAPDTALAYQFHHGESGFVQAFRRPDCAEATLDLVLRGLHAEAEYEFHDHAAARTWHAEGDAALELRVSLPGAPMATTVSYRRVGAA